MSPARERWYRTVFWIAAAYDVALGVAFLFFATPIFEWIGIEDTLPEYTSYIALIAAFLFVIGVAYVLIAMGDLYRNRDLILIGILYKVAYFSVALWYLIDGVYPHILFFYVFGLADLVFAVLMTECWIHLRSREQAWLDGQVRTMAT